VDRGRRSGASGSGAPAGQPDGSWSGSGPLGGPPTPQGAPALHCRQRVHRGQAGPPEGGKRGAGTGDSPKPDMAPVPWVGVVAEALDDGRTRCRHLKAVKEKFEDNKSKYEEFLDVMKDFKAQSEYCSRCACS